MSGRLFRIRAAIRRYRARLRTALTSIEPDDLLWVSIMTTIPIGVAWWIHPGAGLIVFGSLCLFLAWILARGSIDEPPPQR